MKEIVIRAALFGNERDKERSQKSILILLNALVAINMEWLKAHPRTPGLYQSGIRYERENVEVWQAIPQLLASKRGDCEDLACYLTAELRMKGVMAKPFLKSKRVGNFTLFHVVVMLPDGRILDPSKRLGMSASAEV